MHTRSSLTLQEQATNAEVAYYRQRFLFAVTAEDEQAWQRALVSQWPEQYAFARFVLERHGYSLHRYMARHLSPAAWACWFAHGGLVVPIRC